MRVQRIITTLEDMELNFEGITLLTVEEAKALPVEIRKYNDDSWWLRSPGDYTNMAAFVATGFGSSIFTYGNDVECTLGVRPALKISNLTSSDLQIGNKIKVFNYTWTVITENLILCDDAVGRSCFREDQKAPDANDYESSGIKRYIEKWYADQVALAEREE